VRKDAEFFGERDVELIYIAKRLSEAQALEALLTSADLDYLVEADQYFGGFIFQRTRIGAFFYVLPEAAALARQVMEAQGYRPQKAPSEGATAQPG
jgi:hypothetical protein